MDSPIIGASNAKQFDEAVASLEITLSDNEIGLLQEHYTPRPKAGFR